MNKTTIEWTDFTWNPVTGCNKVSQGCKNCYAETIANRFWGERKFTDVQTHPERLSEPARNAKKWAGKKVFVCSMSDLFHEAVPFEFIVDVFQAIDHCRQTTFQILTKRPERALEFFKWAAPVYFDDAFQAKAKADNISTYLPPKNIWIGTSVESQEQADKRIPVLVQIPAAVRFLSCEPLLSHIDLDFFTGVNRDFLNLIHWVIAGGESGHGARPMHPAWVRSLRDQCAAANVPFFFKQWGEYLPINHCDEDMYWASKKSVEVGYGVSTETMFKVGKSKSGNVLDGKQHLEFPIEKSTIEKLTIK